MKLYELTGQWLELMDMAEDPDLNWDVFEDTLEALTGDIHDKADGYGKVIRSIESDIDAIDAEIKRLQKRKQTAANAVDRMKSWLKTNMEIIGEKSIKTDLFSFRIQNNRASVILDTDKIPEIYLIPVDPKVNKQKMYEDLKAGKHLDGIAHLEQSDHLVIR